MKKMHLLVLDEYDELLHDCGTYKIDELKSLIYRASELNLSNFSMISVVQDTYFNIAQLVDMKQEIGVLKAQGIPSTILEGIDDATELTLEEGVYSYLKIDTYG